MRAMVLSAPGTPLALANIPLPQPGRGQVLVRVSACGVCRTDLHVARGELPDPKLPLVLGHEIVGQIADLGPLVTGFALGDRVGVPWLWSTCGTCGYCERGAENLCDSARFTGYREDGGYAEYALADARFCFPSHPAFPTSRPRRSCALGSSDTARSAWRAMRDASASTASGPRPTS